MAQSNNGRGSSDQFEPISIDVVRVRNHSETTQFRIEVDGATFKPYIPHRLLEGVENGARKVRLTLEAYPKGPSGRGGPTGESLSERSSRSAIFRYTQHKVNSVLHHAELDGRRYALYVISELFFGAEAPDAILVTVSEI